MFIVFEVPTWTPEGPSPRLEAPCPPPSVSKYVQSLPPIEALETEFPLRVERYELVRGSGGEGRHRGGDGLVRSLRALEPAWLSLLTERRRHAPQGAAGGAPGRIGRNLLNEELLPSKTTVELEPGDLVTIETPGGGGWG